MALITGVSGNPVLIQSRYGKKGNFEMVVPLATGGVKHFWRSNDEPIKPGKGPHWHDGALFATELGQVEAVSLIQGNYTESGHGPGNFELVLRQGDRLFAYYLPDTPPGAPWKGPFALDSSDLAWVPDLGSKTQQEAVALLAADWLKLGNVSHEGGSGQQVVVDQSPKPFEEAHMNTGHVDITLAGTGG